MKTWAMRGTLHLFRPEEAGAFLSLIASGRSWERPSWQRYFGMTPKQMEALRAAAREVLAGRVLTREELAAAVVTYRGLKHAGKALGSGWGTLLKPLAWQGDVCFGPNRGNRVTFMRPEDASSRWAGIPDPEEAAPIAISAYFRAYGPTTIGAFGNWLAGGWFSQRRLRAWFDELVDEVAEIEVDGERAYVLQEDVDELAATRPTRAVRILPGFDQYVLGPGTGDARIVPRERRTAVSRQSGWISPIVVVGGAVAGTWELDGDCVVISWFGEAGRAPSRAVDAEVARIAAILGRSLGSDLVIV